MRWGLILSPFYWEETESQRESWNKLPKVTQLRSDRTGLQAQAESLQTHILSSVASLEPGLKRHRIMNGESSPFPKGRDCVSWRLRKREGRCKIAVKGSIWKSLGAAGQEGWQLLISLPLELSSTWPALSPRCALSSLQEACTGLHESPGITSVSKVVLLRRYNPLQSSKDFNLHGNDKDRRKESEV